MHYESEYQNGFTGFPLDLTNEMPTKLLLRALGQRKLRQGQNLIWDSNLYAQIDPDLDFSWICPKMHWIHSLVGMNHFAKYRKHRPVTV